MVSNYCQYCKLEKKVINSSNELCTNHRGGILCGSCVEGYSLLLGSYKCGVCNGNRVITQGFFILLSFASAGIILIAVLFLLNITVSTGVLNALIYYSNIVHSNTDALLPIDVDSTNATQLQNAVRFLSTFQAWMNLDFGIVTCLFDGYDTYISTWLQFAFPLYIWALILLIVLASRYSSRVSRLTTSNTVPVLATLLLLSYAKLMTTCIKVISFTKLEVLDDSSHIYIWLLDGKVSYLGPKHVPLFLMSVLTIVLYILPFTALILLGPLLQAKSELKPFRWINKMKPLLDAFYGPHTSRFRCWPGIFLLVRLVLLVTTIYSLGDIVFKLKSVAALSTLLLVIWLLISQSQKISIYTSKSKSYLELFYLANLTFFSNSSAYQWSTERSLAGKQVLAVFMVGSVFVIFCATILYYIIFRFKVLRKCLSYLPSKIKKEAADLTVDGNQIETRDSETTAHSSTELKLCELREPLLTQ